VNKAVRFHQIGGPEVMRGQLEHLIEMSKLPNITIQVMPFRFGGHAAEGGAFTILRFPETDLPDVAYVENLIGAMYLDKRDDVDIYMQAMERLAVDSATPTSVSTIGQASASAATDAWSTGCPAAIGTATRIAGFISGRVIRVNRCQAEAPSTRAAS